MVTITHNQIRAQRYDNGTLLLELTYFDGTPYIMPSALAHPVFAFVVAKMNGDLRYDEDLLIEKYHKVIGYVPYYNEDDDWVQSEYLFDSSIYDNVNDEHTEFVVGDNGDNIDYGSNSDCPIYHRKVYYDAPTNKFVYYKMVDGTPTALDYKFVLTINFEPDDTAELNAGNFKYNLALLDSSVEMGVDTIDDYLSRVTFKDDLLGTNSFIVEESAYV